MTRQTRARTVASKKTPDPMPAVAAAATSLTTTVPPVPADVLKSTSRSQRPSQSRKRAALTPTNAQAKGKRTKNTIGNDSELIDRPKPADSKADTNNLLSLTRQLSCHTSDEEQSQLPDAYIIERELRHKASRKAAVARTQTQTVVEEHNSNSISEDGEDTKLTPSKHTSDDEPVDVVASQFAAEAPSWNRTTTHSPQQDNHSQVAMARPSESGPPVTVNRRSPIQTCQSKREAQRLDEEPQWSASTGLGDQPPSVLPASVVTGSAGGHISVSQATSMAGTATLTSMLTTTSSSVGQLLTAPSPSPGPTMTSSPKDGSPSPQAGSSDYDLVYPKGRSAALSLLAQNSAVQSVIREAFQSVEKHLFTINGLPNTLECAAMARNALVNGANMLLFPLMAQRIARDSKYRKDLSSLVSQRISNEQYTIKKKADVVVPGEYGLQVKVSSTSDGSTSEDVVAMVEWLSNDLMFIYPCNPKPEAQTFQANKPFSHPVIIPLLRSLFFVGSHSHYLRHQDIFISSLLNRPGEREVPMVMLALVCASVYNAICKFETGEERDIEFSHDTAHDVYQELLLLLQQIKSQNPLAYHMLTTQIFNKCIGTKTWKGTSQAVNVADIASMEVD